MKRKVSAIFLSMAVAAMSLAGCGTQNTESVQVENNITEDDIAPKETIICTAFPEYDWVCEILGEEKDSYDVQLLLNSGVDIHSYQPTAEDIAKISKCDLFIYTGGISESWIEDTLKGAVNEEMQVVSLMDELGTRVKTEEIVEGMEHHHDEEAEHEEVEHEGDMHEEDMHEEAMHEEGIHTEEEIAYDEHIWLSLKNAEILVETLEEALVSLDAEKASIFQKNADAYIEKLTNLDAAYQSAAEEAELDTILFGDRFPFRYLTEDYNLNYYAAFTGCSAETEASFETIAFLAEKLDELELPAVLVIESSDQKLAQTIIDNTKTKDQKILVMDSLQSVDRTDLENGVSYLSIMEENLEVLKEALN